MKALEDYSKELGLDIPLTLEHLIASHRRIRDQLIENTRAAVELAVLKQKVREFFGL